MHLAARAALGLTLTVLAGSTARAQDPLFKGWGVTNYERAAPTPEPLPSPVAAIVPNVPTKLKPRSGARERAIAARHDKTTTVAVLDVPAAPTPTTTTVEKSGPVEPAAPTIRDLVSKHARENGVPENLAAAVVRIESRFNPKARGGSALGLMQIKYNTARSMGYAGGVTALMAPETNLHFGMKVLADAYKASKGDLCMTLARYQSGHLVTHASAANRAYCARARSFMANAS